MNSEEYESHTERPQMEPGEIDAALASVMRPWGALGLLDGAAEDHRPGDWWPAFWWSLENKWVGKLADARRDRESEPDTKQTTLVTDGGRSADSSSQATITKPVYERAVEKPRACTVECLTCGRGPTRLRLYAGRDWPWKHDSVTEHDVAYTDFEVVE